MIIFGNELSFLNIPKDVLPATDPVFSCLVEICLDLLVYSHVIKLVLLLVNVNSENIRLNVPILKLNTLLCNIKRLTNTLSLEDLMIKALCEEQCSRV